MDNQTINDNVNDANDANDDAHDNVNAQPDAGAQLARNAAIAAAAGGAAAVAVPTTLIATSFGSSGILAGSLVATAQSAAATGGLCALMGPLMGLAFVPLTAVAIAATVTGFVAGAPNDAMGVPTGLRTDWPYAVVAERGINNFVAFGHETLQDALNGIRAGGWTRRFIVTIDWAAKSWKESAHQGACDVADNRIRAWLHHRINPDTMGEPTGLRDDWPYAVVAERGLGNVVAFAHSTMEDARARCKAGGMTRRFIVQIDKALQTYVESDHAGACPQADDRIRAWLRTRVHMDNMGSPTGLRRNCKYAVVAERGGGHVVAFAHASMEEARERLRMGTLTRRFLAEIDWKKKTYREHMHRGAGPCADNRMRAWLRTTMAASCCAT